LRSLAFSLSRSGVRSALIFGAIVAAVTLSATARGDGPDHADTGGGALGGLIVHAKTEMAAYGDSDAVNVLTPGIEASVENPLSGWTVGGSYLVDIVSAASVDIVSTASPHWHEVRQAGTLNGKYQPGNVGYSISGAVSDEPDYRSLSGGGSLSLDLANKNVVPLIGYSFAQDVAGRSGTPFSVYSHVLDRHTVNMELELVLDPSTLVTFVGNGIFERGDQAKPYRYIPMFAPDVAPNVPAGAPGDEVNQLRLPGRVAERLPLSRNRFALSARLAQRLSSTTFIIDERGYADNWGVIASTTDIRYVVDLSNRFSFWPHLRFYVQSGASFWKLAYVANLGPGGFTDVPEYRAGDRELSPLLEGDFGGGLRWDIGGVLDPRAWSLVFEVEGGATSYRNALFITHRLSEFSSLQLESTFE
jgi:Protein of unknown function (DUF3570)